VAKWRVDWLAVRTGEEKGLNAEFAEETETAMKGSSLW
jgi:hypothetical protein